jgi:hypothetical protein
MNFLSFLDKFFLCSFIMRYLDDQSYYLLYIYYDNILINMQNVIFIEIKYSYIQNNNISVEYNVIVLFK